MLEPVMMEFLVAMAVTSSMAEMALMDCMAMVVTIPWMEVMKMII
jgi:hypothetical protein